MIEEVELENVTTELLLLRSAAIDASSIIYLNKARTIEKLCTSLDLITVPQVIDETGYSDSPYTVWRSAATGSLGADQAILECARACRVPLVSEDRKLLLLAERHGIPFYNALIMLLLLFARGILGVSDYRNSVDLLLTFARYNRRVIDYGERLFSHILKTV